MIQTVDLSKSRKISLCPLNFCVEVLLNSPQRDSGICTKWFYQPCFSHYFYICSAVYWSDTIFSLRKESPLCKGYQDRLFMLYQRMCFWKITKSALFVNSRVVGAQLFWPDFLPSSVILLWKCDVILMKTKPINKLPRISHPKTRRGENWKPANRVPISRVRKMAQIKKASQRALSRDWKSHLP